MERRSVSFRKRQLTSLPLVRHQKTTKAGWVSEQEDIGDAVADLVTFLRALRGDGPHNAWHVVFRYGTVVRLQLPTKTFTGYRRHKNKKADSKRRIWKAQRWALPGRAGIALRGAVRCLIKGGNPKGTWSGLTAAANRRTALWLAFRVGQDPGITNLVYGATLYEATVSGCRLRQKDCTRPKVYAVVDPELRVSRLR